MFSIAIYTQRECTTQNFKDLIQTYFADKQISGRYQTFNNTDNFLTVPNRFDLYIMDLEDNKEEVIKLTEQMKQIDTFGHFIYIDSNHESICESLIAEVDCFLLKPVTQNKFFPLLDKLRKNIKVDTIVISTPEGDRKIRTSDLNYINIEDRCLCYHLKNGIFYDGRSLRGSFEKAVNPLHLHESLIFIAPSLLINLENIEVLNTDHLYFTGENQKLYFPKRHYNAIEARWHKHNNFSNSKILNK